MNIQDLKRAWVNIRLTFFERSNRRARRIYAEANAEQAHQVRAAIRAS